MMEYIAHRRNSVAELNATPVRYGVEVDIRSSDSQLIISHDPFIAGESFEEWLEAYKHGTLILNVKEEGLEDRLISLMDRAAIANYFFLDQSFPYLIKYSKMGVHRCAVRVSEFESINTALTLTGKVDWVWVDCFTQFTLTYDDAKTLQAAGFKLCLVSPELQGRDAQIEIAQTVQILEDRNIQVQAVCTKRPDLWEMFARK
jgi:hypothetical protein